MKENTIGYRMRRAACFAAMFLLLAAVWTELWTGMDFTGARSTGATSNPGSIPVNTAGVTRL